VVKIEKSDECPGICLRVSTDSAEYFFVEIGYETKTEWLKNSVRLTALGQIGVDKECRTSNPGVFAAGDVTDTTYMQVVISAGQGDIAALSAYQYV